VTVSVPDNIFRAYDIRGIVDQGLDETIVELIGRAVGSETLDLGEDSLIVGADARLSSPAFAMAMIRGILATGCNVVYIGTVPTPVLYFATYTCKSNSGVMITGSHNPRDYNGVKIVLQNQCLAADQITRLKERIIRNDFQSGAGRMSDIDVVPGYLKRVCSDIHLSRPYKVVIDCGNGVSAICAPMLFSAIGCQVVALYCEADGNFPNHHPDPTRRENLEDLVALVIAEKADLGIAFDGDGDRVGLVSSSGEIIDADSMLLAFAADILPDNAGARIVFDVKSSRRIPRLVEQLGGIPVMCKSGHSFVKQQMQACDALLGGEYSAHLFFRHRWFGFDDGHYAAARFLELMGKTHCTADDLLAVQPTCVNTPELFVAVSEDDKFSIMATLQVELKIPGAEISHLDGFRADTGDAWGLVRASNTSPNLVLRFEADTPEALARLRQRFRVGIATLFPDLDLSALDKVKYCHDE
jgi:phosphomannomutase/phosphoglucomutase